MSDLRPSQLFLRCVFKVNIKVGVVTKLLEPWRVSRGSEISRLIHLMLMIRSARWKVLTKVDSNKDESRDVEHGWKLKIQLRLLMVFVQFKVDCRALQNLNKMKRAHLLLKPKE